MAAKKGAKEPSPAPGALRQAGLAIKARWLGFARVLAKVNSAVILTIIYVFIIAPINVVCRIVRADLMGKKIGEEKTFWTDPEGPTLNLNESRRQF